MLKNVENQRSLLNYDNKFIKIKSAREKLFDTFKDLISPLNSSPRKHPPCGQDLRPYQLFNYDL